MTYWPFQIVEAWAIFLFWTGHLDVSCDERAAALLRSLTQEYWILFWVSESLSQNWLSSVGHALLPRLPFLLPMFIFQFASDLPYLVILPFGKVWLMTICGLTVFLKFASIYESKIRITDYNKKAMKKFIHSIFLEDTAYHLLFWLSSWPTRWWAKPNNTYEMLNC